MVSTFIATLAQVFESCPAYSGYRIFGNEDNFRVDFVRDRNYPNCKTVIVEAERKPHGFDIRCGDLCYDDFGAVFESIWAHESYMFRAYTNEKCERWNRVNIAMQSLTVVMSAQTLLYTYDDNKFSLLMRDRRLLEFVYDPSNDTLSYTCGDVIIARSLCDFYCFAAVANQLSTNDSLQAYNDYLMTKVPVGDRVPCAAAPQW